MKSEGENLGRSSKNLNLKIIGSEIFDQNTVDFFLIPVETGLGIS